MTNTFWFYFDYRIQILYMCYCQTESRFIWQPGNWVARRILWKICRLGRNKHIRALFHLIKKRKTRKSWHLHLLFVLIFVNIPHIMRIIFIWKVGRFIQQDLVGRNVGTFSGLGLQTILWILLPRSSVNFSLAQ